MVKYQHEKKIMHNKKHTRLFPNTLIVTKGNTKMYFFKTMFSQII